MFESDFVFHNDQRLTARPVHLPYVNLSPRRGRWRLWRGRDLINKEARSGDLPRTFAGRNGRRWVHCVGAGADDVVKARAM